MYERRYNIFNAAGYPSRDALRLGSSCATALQLGTFDVATAGVVSMAARLLHMVLPIAVAGPRLSDD